MVRAFLTIVVFVFLTSSLTFAQSSDTVHIASFNIHYIVPHDNNDDWEERRHAVTRVLEDMNADIVAFQEMETFDGGHYSERNLQLEWIMSTTMGYDAAAIGNPEVFPSTQPILYKDSKYVAEEQGFFFFSNTPDEIYSEQWNGGYPYFCSWARFRIENTEKKFYVFNVHNDFKSRSNRLKTSELVATRIKKIVQKDSPVIVLGDFNVPNRFKEIRLLEGIGLSVVPPNGATNRVLGMHLLPAIDHILVNDVISVQSGIKVWRGRYDDIYPADHYPISVNIML